MWRFLSSVVLSLTLNSAFAKIGETPSQIEAKMGPCEHRTASEKFVTYSYTKLGYTYGYTFLEGKCVREDVVGGGPFDTNYIQFTNVMTFATQMTGVTNWLKIATTLTYIAWESGKDLRLENSDLRKQSFVTVSKKNIVISWNNHPLHQR